MNEKHRTNEVPTNEVPTNGQGQGDPISMSGGATLSEESSDSGVSASLYFFILGIVLLILIASVCLITSHHCKRKTKQQQQQFDVEAASIQHTNESRRQINSWVCFAIMFIGHFIGLALSIFSITTCQFLDLEPPLELDTPESSYMNPVSITIYSLGLWSATLDTNSVISGCVNAAILPFLDWAFKLARASAVLANLFGGICPLILLIFLIIPEFRTHTRHLIWPLLLATLFQLMTLSLFGSGYCKYDFDGENVCEVSLGAAASITAALYWMFGMFACTNLPLNDTIITNN